MPGLRSKVTVTGSITPESALVKNADGSAISTPTYSPCVLLDATNGIWQCDAPAPAGTYAAGAQMVRLPGTSPLQSVLSLNAATVAGATTPTTGYVGPLALFFAGDSRTYGYSSWYQPGVPNPTSDEQDALSKAQNYVSQLKPILGETDYLYYNTGYPSRRSDAILSLIDSEILDPFAALQAAGTVVKGVGSLFTGFNDFNGAKTEGRSQHDAGLVLRANVLSWVQKALAKFAAIIVWIETPQNYQIDDAEYAAFQQWTRDNYKSWGANVYLMDCALLSIVPGSSDMPDNLHPSAALHKRIAQQLAPIILQIRQDMVANAGDTPTAPTVAYNATTRLLTASHALGVSQVQYRRKKAAWQAYADVQVDNGAYDAREWEFHVKPASGRNPSGLSGSPATTAVAAPTPAPGNVISVTGFSPSTAPVGATVTVKGTKFTGAVAVTINGVNTNNSQVVDDNTITFTVPSTDNVGKITVILNGTEYATSADVFTGTAASNGGGTTPTQDPNRLSIASITPLTAAVGATVTVRGTHFANVVALTINGVSVDNNRVVDDTTITFVVPATNNSGKITVIISGSEYVTSADTFTGTAAPTNTISITDFSPKSAAVGETVTVRGTKFTGVVAVTINGVNTNNSRIIDDNTLTFNVPPTDNTGKITVIISGSEYATSTDIFTGTAAS